MDDATVTDDKLFELDSRYATDLPELAIAWQPAPVPDPGLVVCNDELADELGLDVGALRSADGVAVLAGNAVPAGATPAAMAYAGHQFGGYSPRLGDGRALLLGELADPQGRRWDLHLKGSGRTPFARGGDGKATIGPMLREFLIAEAMHGLGVPTTRALAVTTTGEQVMRTGPEPGAVLTRVAASHLRVGTFEYAARLEDPSVLSRLVDHAIARHHREAAEAERPALALLDAVIGAQARLIAQWMAVGFIHGVMNTDNMTISGEGIDYGPCAFMDRYDPSTVFSSIDHGGRYAYGNQPVIAQWNLARLAETLLPLIDPDAERAVELATESLTSFPTRYELHHTALMRTKLGLVDAAEGDDDLVGGLLTAMHERGADFTSTFRALAQAARDPAGVDAPVDAASMDRWTERLEREGRTRTDIAAQMDSVNPVYIPRNHLVAEALDAATAGDLDPFRVLLDVVRQPFERQAGLDRFAEPANPSFTESFQTFCGT